MCIRDSLCTALLQGHFIAHHLAQVLDNAHPAPHLSFGGAWGDLQVFGPETNGDPVACFGSLGIRGNLGGEAQIVASAVQLDLVVVPIHRHCLLYTSAG